MTASRKPRAQGQRDDLPFSLQEALEQVLPSAVASIVRQELMQVRAIGLLLTRRRDVRAGEVAIPYHGALVPMLLLLCFVDTLAAGLLHLLLPEAWRPVALVVAALGLVWLLGCVASLVCYPHVVSPERLRLRFAAFHDICLPTSAVTTVRTTRQEPSTQKSAEIVGTELGMPVLGQADVVIDLAQATAIRSLHRNLQGAQIARATFHATDGKRAAEAVRRHVGAVDAT